jgi:nucleoside-diphosphate-sugar epimerase
LIRVLVLGAEGFVGKAVMAALQGADWAVPTSLEPAMDIGRALETADAVVNCVTGKPQTILTNAQRLFAAIGRIGSRPQVVHLGSMTVYGSARGVVDESSPLLADLGGYSQAQLQADQLAAAYPEAIRLRLGCEYGPGCVHWTGVIARCLQSGRLGDLGAAGDGYCNLLFIDDLVAAVLESLRRPQLRGRAFNLATDAPPTWNEYLVRFAKAVGAVPVRRVSRRRLRMEAKVLAPPLKVAQVVFRRLGLTTPPPISPSLVAVCGQDIRLAVDAARRSLDLQWTPLEVGIQRAAAWYGEHPAA